jgi:hypothetical protein
MNQMISLWQKVIYPILAAKLNYPQITQITQIRSLELGALCFVCVPGFKLKPIKVETQSTKL